MMMLFEMFDVNDHVTTKNPLLDDVYPSSEPETTPPSADQDPYRLP